MVTTYLVQTDSAITRKESSCRKRSRCLRVVEDLGSRDDVQTERRHDGSLSFTLSYLSHGTDEPTKTKNLAFGVL